MSVTEQAPEIQQAPPPVSELCHFVREDTDEIAQCGTHVGNAQWCGCPYDVCKKNSMCAVCDDLERGVSI